MAEIKQAAGGVEIADQADFLAEPFEDLARVALTLEEAAEPRAPRRRAFALETEERFEDMVGRSPRMTEVFELVAAAAYASSTVLIQGESGTGKELVARALHRRSPRRDEPFLAVNCAALTETLLESELFGHAKGAFTGASSAKHGLFQAADGGTLFLDEIGDMPPSTQVRVLRVLQEGELRPVGATETVTVDVRVIAATHVDLQVARASGRLREDLFYRLNVISIQLPPLRDRPEDIPAMVSHFAKRYAAKTGKRITGVSPAALRRLCTYTWPGNVRELENAIERAVVLSRGAELFETDLPPGIVAPAPAAAGEVDASSLLHLPYREARMLTLRAFDRRYVLGLLTRAHGNITRAAEFAQMDRSNFRRVLKASGVAAHPEPEDAAEAQGPAPRQGSS